VSLRGFENHGSSLSLVAILAKAGIHKKDTFETRIRLHDDQSDGTLYIGAAHVLPRLQAQKSKLTQKRQCKEPYK